MTTPSKEQANIEQAVPGFWVHDINQSVRFYTEGWDSRRRINGCTRASCAGAELEAGSASSAGMRFPSGASSSPAALLQSSRLLKKGIGVTEIEDPDGYKLFFESPTDVPEDTVLE